MLIIPCLYFEQNFCSARKSRPSKFGVRVIKLNDSKRTPIGELHIHWYVKERESWEIGYCIFPEYRGHGYCVKAAKIALKYAFEDWNAHKVVAMCNEFNIASCKVRNGSDYREMNL